MPNESRRYGAATVLTLVGLVVMLYGVSLTAGAALNELMIGGGVVVAVGIGIIMVEVMRLEAAAESE